jgi:hypothetical protein
MFDEPQEEPKERIIDPAVQAREKADELRIHAEIAAVFEGGRKFEAQLTPGLDAQVARDVQRGMARMDKSKTAGTPVLPAASAAEAAEVLNLFATRGLSANDYHIHRRPGEVMIIRWLAGEQVETFYERLQAHFDAALNGYRQEERQNQEWKQDPKTLAYLAALDAMEVKMADRYLREEIRKHNLFVLSTQTADEMNIAYLCDYVMGISAAEVVGEASAPPDDATEKDLAWFYKLFLLRGYGRGWSRCAFSRSCRSRMTASGEGKIVVNRGQASRLSSMRTRREFVGMVLFLAMLPGLSRVGDAAERHCRGLWVWKTAAVLGAPKGAEALRNFCKSNNINEVYISVAASRKAGEDERIAAAIELLHQSKLKVEALLSSTTADEPGKPRDKLIEEARDILAFNEKHGQNHFDGIHLDIEPHQRLENKGAGNLQFLPNLIETFRAVRGVAEPARMSVNADIESKILKSSVEQRKALFTSVNRITLMLYEQSHPGDGKSPEQKFDKLRRVTDKFMATAYEGLEEGKAAKMSIALRTPDYGDLLPEMLAKLHEAFRKNPHYLGWGRHCYNDHLK